MTTIKVKVDGEEIRVECLPSRKSDRRQPGISHYRAMIPVDVGSRTKIVPIAFIVDWNAQKERAKTADVLRRAIREARSEIELAA